MAARNVSLFILYSPDGKILLQHRSKDALMLPDYWAFFGGGIEKGENPEQALKREVLEELSYEVQSPLCLATQKFVHKDEEGIKYVFVEKYQNHPLTLREGQGMGWFLPDETEKLKMMDCDRTVILQIRDYLNSLD